MTKTINFRIATIHANMQQLGTVGSDAKGLGGHRSIHRFALTSAKR